MDPLRPLLNLPLWRSAGWARVRAIALLLHIIAIAAVACPAPLKGGSKKQWDRPGVRAEVRAWQSRLRSVGVDVSEAALVDFGWRVSTSWGSARHRVLTPVSTYLNKVGSPQGWYMFTAPDRTPQRFQVQVVDEGGVRPVFVLGEDSAWPEIATDGFLSEHRVRRALFQTSWSDREVAMRDVCAYFGRRALAVDPQLVEVRCAQWQQDVIHPWRRDVPRPPPAERRVLRLRAASLQPPSTPSTTTTTPSTPSTPSTTTTSTGATP